MLEAVAGMLLFFIPAMRSALLLKGINYTELWKIVSVEADSPGPASAFREVGVQNGPTEDQAGSPRRRPEEHKQLRPAAQSHSQVQEAGLTSSNQSSPATGQGRDLCAPD
jgi:hypothetical protein